jgi:membrane-associated phospholipid phosphatase
MPRAHRFTIRPQDLISGGFLVSLILLVLLTRGGLTDWHWLLGRYLVLLVLQSGVVVARGRGLPPVLTNFFPLVPVLAIYDSLRFIPELNPGDRDDLLVRIDRALLGGDASLWFERISTPWLTELFQLAYLVYYVLPFLLLGTLHRRSHASGIAPEQRSEAEAVFDQCMVALLLSHYLAFVGYMAVPALGPRFALAPQYRTRLTGLVLAERIGDLLNAMEGIKRDAFPSGHTSAALVSLYYAFRFTPRLARWALPPVVLMIISTMYLRYHYAADILAGMILAALCIFLARRPARLDRATGCLTGGPRKSGTV